LHVSRSGSRQQKCRVLKTLASLQDADLSEQVWGMQSLTMHKICMNSFVMNEAAEFHSYISCYQGLMDFMFLLPGIRTGTWLAASENCLGRSSISSTRQRQCHSTPAVGCNTRHPKSTPKLHLLYAPGACSSFGPWLC
jgi:hypothetical protein